MTSFGPIRYVNSFRGVDPSMCKIGKRRQLNEKERDRAVRDLCFYKTRWILKFSFKHNLMNEIDIFLNMA